MSLPRVYAGRRRALLLWLIVDGSCQALLALSGALLLRTALAPGRWATPALAGLTANAVLIVALRMHAAGVGERLGQDYALRVRLRIFEAVTARPLRSARAPRAGLAMTRVIGDLGSLRNWVSNGLARSCVAAVTLAVMLGPLTWLRPRAGAVLASVVLATAAVAALLVPRLRRNVREARRRRGRLSANLGEKLLAARTVRHLGRMREERRRVRSHSRWLGDALARRARASELMRALPDLVTPAAISLWLIAAGPGDAGELVAGVLLLGLIGTSLRDLTRGVDHRLSFEEGRRRIASLLAEPRLEEPRRGQALDGCEPLALEFDGVGVDGLFRGASFDARSGERILVSGGAGRGKSTLLALAARLLDPDTGEVRIDGKPARDISLDALHEAVQLVSPELPLLRGSVADNLGYGVTDADPSWLERVAEACGLHDGSALPEGLATQVEERGANLSAGLRARLTLARALAMRPRLLLVDDPAFALDGRATAALRAACALHPATTLVVAPEGAELLEWDRVWHLGGADGCRARPAYSDQA